LLREVDAVIEPPSPPSDPLGLTGTDLLAVGREIYAGTPPALGPQGRADPSVVKRVGTSTVRLWGEGRVDVVAENEREWVRLAGVFWWDESVFRSRGGLVELVRGKSNSCANDVQKNGTDAACVEG